MIFSKDSKNIITRWTTVLHSCDALRKVELDAFNKAMGGFDVGERELAHVVNLSATNLRLENINELPDLIADSKAVLKEIRKHYDIEVNESTITLTKREKTKMITLPPKQLETLEFMPTSQDLAMTKTGKPIVKNPVFEFIAYDNKNTYSITAYADDRPVEIIEGGVAPTEEELEEVVTYHIDALRHHGINI